MGNSTHIDITQKDSSSDNVDTSTNYFAEQNSAIRKICSSLSISSTSDSVDKSEALIREYKENPKFGGRWPYSEISSFLFERDEKAIGRFLSNIDSLRSHARKKADEDPEYEDMYLAIEKLWDHAHLAERQAAAFRHGDEDFETKFEKYITPFEAKFSREMNMQLLSLIAIFTALSFLVFGGISSLDNIFAGAKDIPILKLMIIGSIWSLCISNLVFFFLYFTAKLTKTEIRTSTNTQDNVFKQHFFIIGVNFILLLILAVSCLLYYIDYSNSGSWLLIFSANHPIVSTLIGVAFILLTTGLFFYLVFKKRKP